jgi:hypothetical protein
MGVINIANPKRFFFSFGGRYSCSYFLSTITHALTQLLLLFYGLVSYLSSIHLHYHLRVLYDDGEYISKLFRYLTKQWDFVLHFLSPFFDDLAPSFLGCPSWTFFFQIFIAKNNTIKPSLLLRGAPRLRTNTVMVLPIEQPTPC